MKLPFIACLFAATFSAGELPPEFSQHSDEELKWRGLATLYPGKVLTEPPASFAPHSPREPLEVKLPYEVTYLRIYDLPLAMEAIEAVAGQNKLVLDLRYLHSEQPEALAKLLRQMRGDFPAMILVNHRTSGELEIALADLQAAEKVLTIGTHTAGQTGTYRPVPELDGFFVLEDESLTAEGESLLGTGLTPRISVTVAPKDDFRAYELVERGTSVEAVLGMDLSDDSANSSEAEDTEEVPADAILQRALDVIVALQVLGKLPPS
ncbi:MAG: hypothetical protein AAGF10_04195 [Verrucomicrobiota bacterium]